MLTAFVIAAALLARPALASPAELAQTDLDLGRQLLAEKNADGAELALKRCIGRQADPAITVECQWELGWASWVQADWTGVVAAWEAVQKVDPQRKGLADSLAQARDQAGLQAIVAKGKAAAPATFSSTAPAGTTLRMRAVGDMMIGTDFQPGQMPPDDGVSMFADVAALLKDADLTLGNLEGPLCDGGSTDKCSPDTPPGRCYAFRTPERYGKYYKEAGFDVLTTANNHAGDFGEFCRERTEAVLDAQGIAHTGRPGDIASMTVNGLKVAVIGFHTSQNSHYLNDHDTAAALVKALSTEHDLVVVTFHGGAEGSKAIRVPQGSETFYGENRGNLRQFARVVIDAGADAVIGHGPHVLRGMEVYKERLVAYSLGNFATYGPFNVSGNNGISAVLELQMDREGRFLGGKVLPTWLEGEGVPMRDAQGRAIDLLRTLSAEDFPGTAVQIAQDGSLSGPVGR